MGRLQSYYFQSSRFALFSESGEGFLLLFFVLPHFLPHFSTASLEGGYFIHKFELGLFATQRLLLSHTDDLAFYFLPDTLLIPDFEFFFQ
jgi:hypothetical protein